MLGTLYRHEEHQVSSADKKGRPPRDALKSFQKEVGLMKPAELKSSLSMVLQELDNTENEIARQSLKIALSKKVNTFDKKSK